LAFAQHDPRRNFDRRGDLANQIDRWGQSAGFVMADNLKAIGPAAFGGDGVFDRANDNFENVLFCHLRKLAFSRSGERNVYRSALLYSSSSVWSGIWPCAYVAPDGARIDDLSQSYKHCAPTER